MNTSQESATRIFVVFRLTFREALRRRLIFIFLSGCLLLMLTGAGCGACMRVVKDSETDVIRAQFEDQLARAELSQAEREQERARFEQAMEERAAESDGAVLRDSLVAISFCALAGWLYLLSALFTPFIAMNDFHMNHHVLLLSGPLRRWEYLTGKFLAIYGMVLAAMVLMLACFHPLMRISQGDWAFAILPGMAVLCQGLEVFILMMMVLSLVAGRLPAIFLSLVVLGLSVVPGFLISTDTTIDSPTWAIPAYVLGYGLPQFSVNFVHAATVGLDHIEGVESLLQQTGIKRIGNASGFVSLLLNTAWIVGLGGLALWLFRRREFDT